MTFWLARLETSGPRMRLYCERLPSLLVGWPSKYHRGRPRMPVGPPSLRLIAEVTRGLKAGSRYLSNRSGGSMMCMSQSTKRYPSFMRGSCCARGRWRPHPGRLGAPAWLVNARCAYYYAKIGANLRGRPCPTRPRRRVREVICGLRARIASHALPPGARLREWDVAAEFGVPRLSARAALDALVHLGFAERQPNRGILVRRRDLAEILGLFDLRAVNEGLCARLAATGVPPESWQDLVELFGAPMQDIVARRDLDAYVRHYEHFRHRLMAAAALPPLNELLERLNDMTAVYGRRLLLVSDRTQHALHEHRAVLAALRQGDAAAAERLRRATIANVRAALARYHAFVL